MSDGLGSDDRPGRRARRGAARLTVGAYHEEQLRLLLEQGEEPPDWWEAGEPPG